MPANALQLSELPWFRVSRTDVGAAWSLHQKQANLPRKIHFSGDI